MATKLTKTEMKTIHVHEEIRRYRNEGCYTQEYVAHQLGLAQSTYQRIESGEVNITLERLKQIALILNKPLEAFLNKDNKSGSKIIVQNEHMIQISQSELELLHKMIIQQEKRIEELEAKLMRRDKKIEVLVSAQKIDSKEKRQDLY